MNLSQKLTTLVVVILAASTSAFAQMQQAPAPINPDSVSDTQLEKVAAISGELQQIQMEANEKVKAIVEEEGMKFSRFQQIAMAQRNPQASNVELTAEEKSTLQKVQPKLMKVNQDSRKEFSSVVQEEGMTVQKFQQISQAISTNSGLKERFDTIKSENTEN